MALEHRRDLVAPGFSAGDEAVPAVVVLLQGGLEVRLAQTGKAALLRLPNEMRDAVDGGNHQEAFDRADPAAGVVAMVGLRAAVAAVLVGAAGVGVGDRREQSGRKDERFCMCSCV